MSAYPTNPDFIKKYLFGEGETDPLKIKVCENLSNALNTAYSTGKGDGAAGIDRQREIVRISWGAFVKSGIFSFLRNCKAEKIISGMIKEAYTEGYNMATGKKGAKNHG